MNWHNLCSETVDTLGSYISSNIQSLSRSPEISQTETWVKHNIKNCGFRRPVRLFVIAGSIIGLLGSKIGASCCSGPFNPSCILLLVTLICDICWVTLGVITLTACETDDCLDWTDTGDFHLQECYAHCCGHNWDACIWWEKSLTRPPCWGMSTASQTS